jgi:hypothetical protein
MAVALRIDAGLEHLFIASTIVRARQRSAGAQEAGFPHARRPATSPLVMVKGAMRRLH